MSWLLRVWLPIAVAVTGVCGLTYVTVQQSYRQSLNDPQIQMAEDAVQKILSGATPASITGKESVNISQSLAPFLIIYDAKLKPLASSGKLDDAAPVPPAGVFANAAVHGEDRVTWQPQPSTRIAAVVAIVPGEKGYVLAGRNMREVEAREWALESAVGIAWIVILAATLFAVWFGVEMSTRLERY
ncbi:MAG: hypothetical protein WC050_03295 [Candidatus Paceibacterota bacterium]